jgi:biopolymer transport protein TolQ
MHYFWVASPVVKAVMFILLALSVASWTVIFQRGFFLRRVKRACHRFEEHFWTSENLTELYKDMREQSEVVKPHGLQPIFQAGFRELSRFSGLAEKNPGKLFEEIYRAMRVACAKEVENLSQHLSFLATVGSTTPYIGLFGTVWGIMSSFQALGSAQQVTIAMVAPGISEALVATAMGLFAAIPAVIAYNRYNHWVEILIGKMETFQDEFTGLLTYQTQGGS